MKLDTTSTYDAPLRRRPRHLGRGALVATAVALVAVLAPAGAAFAATGTSSATTTSGSLSIGTTTPETISVPVAGTGNGILPSAVWADTTGTGDGWNGTVAVSDLSYTGAWVAQGSATALTTATSGAFTGTQDGVEYTVTTGTITSGAGSYTWTSTDTTTGNPTGSGTAVASTANLVGTLGVTIDFGTQSLTSGYVYVIKAGTQAASAFSLDTSATGASIAPVSGTTVSGGGVASSAYGTAVKFVSAALNTGMGSYTVDPGAQVAADASSWATTYTAGVQFSIVTGP
ncbi:MAG: hypothetical protein ACYCXY_11430 [Acidimicrobiales bacterium]